MASYRRSLGLLTQSQDADALEHTVCFKYLRSVLHIVICRGVECTCANDRTQAFVDGFRTHFEYVYVLYRRLLQGYANANQDAGTGIGLWELCATILGVTEQQLEARWATEGACMNPCCRTRGSDKVQMKQCTGCRTVRYCSVKCQKAYVNMYGFLSRYS
jgi:hypothetical protein